MSLPTILPLLDEGLGNQATTVVDVRQRSEYASGHVPGSLNVELGAIGSATLPGGPVVTICGHGERAASAASMLEQRGRSDVRVMPGGPDDWARVTGAAVEAGP